MPARLVSKEIGSVARGFNPTALIPPGVVMESVDDTGTAVVITVRSSTSVGDCPGSGGTSHRVHSRYTRSLADLPLGGRPVKLRLLVRRFRCDRALCTRRIFSERLVAATPWARRTARLDEIVHHLGLRSAAVRPRALASGSGCWSATTPSFGLFGAVEARRSQRRRWSGSRVDTRVRRVPPSRDPR